MAENPASTIISTLMTSQHHQVFIDEEIIEPRYYRNIINLLTTVPENDVVEIMINSYGGRLDSAGAIVEAIDTCRGTVKAVVIGSCMSAATLIMLACPEIIILDSARVMLHTCTFGAYGKSSDVKAQVDYTHRVESKMMRDAYMGFLSFEEIEQLENGKEFWFDADETIERIKSRDKYLEDLHSVVEPTEENTNPGA